MISHTPHSVLEKKIEQLNSELEVRNQLILSMRLEIRGLKKNKKEINTGTIEHKKIEDLTNILHAQNALISDLKRGITDQQAKILNNNKVNSLLENNKKLETKLLAANETIKLLKSEKTDTKMKNFAHAKSKAHELADVLVNSLEEASPSIPVKEYLERIIHTLRKTTDISILEHFFIQAIEGFESKAQELKFQNKPSNLKKQKKGR